MKIVTQIRTRVNSPIVYRHKGVSCCLTSGQAEKLRVVHDQIRVFSEYRYLGADLGSYEENFNQDVFSEERCGHDREEAGIAAAQMWGGC